VVDADEILVLEGGQVSAFHTEDRIFHTFRLAPPTPP
jgi:ABC-type protease/lipase transport system fused ATPase/permease subunit